MRVQMRQTMAGPQGVTLAGQQVDVPDPLGRQLIAGGYAVAVGPAPAETATAEPAQEATVDPRAPGRRRR